MNIPSPIKVVTDGTRLGTKVIDTRTGEMLQGVKSVRLKVSGDCEIAVTVLEVIAVPWEFVDQEEENGSNQDN